MLLPVTQSLPQRTPIFQIQIRLRAARQLQNKGHRAMIKLDLPLTKATLPNNQCSNLKLRGPLQLLIDLKVESKSREVPRSKPVTKRSLLLTSQARPVASNRTQNPDAKVAQRRLPRTCSPATKEMIAKSRLATLS